MLIRFGAADVNSVWKGLRSARILYAVGSVLVMGISACYVPFGFQELEAGALGSQSGSEDDPYIIKSVGTLIDLLQGDAVDLSAHYKLGADLDMSEVDNWEPIATGTAGFTGSFDGAGHTIREFALETTDNNPWGLFALIAEEGIIQNLGLEGVNLEAPHRASQKGALAAVNHGTIEQSFATGTVKGADKLGGLVGINHGTIRESYAIVDVENGNVAGGLVGENDAGTITESYAAGPVFEVDGQAEKGGLAGRNLHAGLLMRTFYDTEVSEMDGVGNEPENDGVMGLTSEQATSENTFIDEDLDYYVDFDFDNVWSIDPSLNDEYPYLLRAPPMS